ncbi:hypothetical protein PR048_007240 [Dryococelus australis]|uniref:DDE Tnp4 domain-containing protein n=1 Tax=Dryococelus australis TaxID=614101 RepID=A0ABQ9IDM2_9NEOP|nr:hypothetical protein PR048_007240 [Dryococelus australis]
MENKNFLNMRRERKILRGDRDPYDLNEEHFRKVFRYSREISRYLCNTSSPRLNRLKRNGIAVEIKCSDDGMDFLKLGRIDHNLKVGYYLKLIHNVKKCVLADLRCYACGSFQRSVCQNFLVAMSQSPVSRCVDHVGPVIIELLRERIKFPETGREQTNIQQSFMNKHGFPGVIGSIDCTHVAVFPPLSNNPDLPENISLNRKGTHSKNLQLIYGPDLKICNVNARCGGSTHDAFIWRNSAIRVHLAYQLTAVHRCSC